MSTVLPIQLPPLDNTFGAMLLGMFIGLMIYGVNLHQAYRYFRRYPRDSLILKALVLVVSTMDTAAAVLSINPCYQNLIGDFFHPEDLLYTSWNTAIFPLCTAAVMLPCQSFFAWRVWRLAPKFRIMVVVTGVLYIGELTVFIVATYKLSKISHILETTKVMRMITAASISGLAADSMLTAALIVVLHRSRTGFKRTDSKIDVLIMYSVNTGFLTGVFNMLYVIFAYTKPYSMLYVATTFIGVKMYTATLLAALNSRRSSASHTLEDVSSADLVFGSSGGLQASLQTLPGPSDTQARARQLPVQTTSPRNETAIIELRVIPRFGTEVPSACLLAIDVDRACVGEP
ncbi:hypothetical protein C8Q73DRAFT_285947 [Cubamyces lactineus]|nr:hypothetical protein C8Q73DRAFT_285947 [Cubamyces lactineus]